MSYEHLVRELTGNVLAKVAPEELVLLDTFDPESTEYEGVAQGPQGFGAETAIALALPFVYKFIDKFVERLAANLADDLSAAVKRWLASPTDDKSETQVCARVRAELTSMGMPPADAASAAGAIITTIHQNASRLPLGE